jgi:cephalosporin-C deacetylase-like acetyl esterase
VLPGVDGEGIFLRDSRNPPLAYVIVIPDADQTPEQLSEEGQIARRLAELGCNVLVPTLIDRKDEWSGSPRIDVMTNQPHREFVYRMAFEMGRHVIGYEVQKVLAAADYFAGQPDGGRVGVFGYGEGGMLALFCAALDDRIEATVVSGYFGPREQVWQEPIYRNVWKQLTEFGDLELALMVLPRTLIVEDVPGPKVDGPPAQRPGRRGGAAPGKITYTAGAARAEAGLPMQISRQLKLPEGRGVSVHTPGAGETKHEKVAVRLLHALGKKQEAKKNGRVVVEDLRGDRDPVERQHRQFNQLVDYTQKLLPECDARRKEFWAKPDRFAADTWAADCQQKRDYFWEETIGKLPAPNMPMNPRTRLIYDEPTFKGYEVVLDLYEDVICYGILLVPNDIKPGEKRPVVVCQHGLEGRPTDVCNPHKKTNYYNSFGAQLVRRGFIVFAPQNPYIGQEKFRVLLRKGNPVGLTLYSFIVCQHERILDWLCSLPFVDPARIAYYGLSYGGKVAMRIPALLGRYCVVICSGDFNEWIWKNINLVWPNSYMFTVEYDMYEFNLANTFNYAEMAALIAPRPFMVERGHDDGVGLDEWVAYEFAKVRRLYARLGIPERTEIEFFSGAHEIHGRGTFAFLHRHLSWPEKK